jgi:hypothetical protein
MSLRICFNIFISVSVAKNRNLKPVFPKDKPRNTATFIAVSY